MKGGPKQIIITHSHTNTPLSFLIFALFGMIQNHFTKKARVFLGSLSDRIIQSLCQRVTECPGLNHFP